MWTAVVSAAPDVRGPVDTWGWNRWINRGPCGQLSARSDRSTTSPGCPQDHPQVGGQVVLSRGGSRSPLGRVTTVCLRRFVVTGITPRAAASGWLNGCPRDFGLCRGMVRTHRGLSLWLLPRRRTVKAPWLFKQATLVGRVPEKPRRGKRSRVRARGGSKISEDPLDFGDPADEKPVRLVSLSPAHTFGNCRTCAGGMGARNDQRLFGAAVIAGRAV